MTRRTRLRLKRVNRMAAGYNEDIMRTVCTKCGRGFPIRCMDRSGYPAPIAHVPRMRAAGYRYNFETKQLESLPAVVAQRTERAIPNR